MLDDEGMMAVTGERSIGGFLRGRLARSTGIGRRGGGGIEQMEECDAMRCDAM